MAGYINESYLSPTLTDGYIVAQDYMIQKYLTKHIQTVQHLIHDEYLCVSLDSEQEQQLTTMIEERMFDLLMQEQYYEHDDRGEEQVYSFDLL